MVFALQVQLPDSLSFFFFFFNDTATTEIYTLSLHDALPICLDLDPLRSHPHRALHGALHGAPERDALRQLVRSEEHTSELQSLAYLVCRLLLEKKNNIELRNRLRITYNIRHRSYTAFPVAIQ